MIKNKKLISLLLSVILAFSCFAVFASAGSLTVVSQPKNRTLYQGIDWKYNGTIISLFKDPNLTGTVISDGNRRVAYSASNTPNMFAMSDSGKWVEGSNTVRIYCDGLSGYAKTTFTLAAVKSISVISPPSNTVLVKGVDWNEGPLGDVEFTEYDLTGLTLSVKYSDGSVKTVSYPENKFIGWSVGKDYTELKPGKATLLATFCGKTAPFEVTFVTSNPYKLGDVTKDGKINSHDALVILQFSTGSINLDKSKKKLADVNKDNNVNSLDALHVLQYTVGKISSL